MNARFVRRHLENRARTVYTFWFEPERPVNWLAGQYIEMTLPHADPDSRGTKRWFTLSSSPTQAPLISITTKLVAQNGSSFKRALMALRPGDAVHISEPMGDFVLPKDPDLPLVFVAGGIGITPFHSIITFLLDTKQARNVTLIYAVAQPQDMVFEKTFERYGMNRLFVTSRPDRTWDGLTGQLSGQRIVTLARPADDGLIYLSGPEPMVESLQNQLLTAGFNQNRIVGDFFPGYTML